MRYYSLHHSKDITVMVSGHASNGFRMAWGGFNKLPLIRNNRVRIST
jgi:hypothetical protein